MELEKRKYSLQVTSDDENDDNNSSSSKIREKITISRQKTPVEFAFMSIRSPITKKQYPRRLKLFFDYLGLEEGSNSLEEQAQTFLTKAKEEPDYWVEDSILFYLNYHKDRVLKTKEIAAGTLYNLYAPIIIFCKRHKHSLPPIDWDMLSESLPAAKTSASDRAPTIEEIRKLVEYPDRRIKPLVYVMCSSGIRLGAWDYLRWKHVSPISNEKGEVVAAKLIVYAGEPEEHFSFISAEAYNALKDYLDVRALHGEKITGESLLIRDEWRDSDTKIGPGGKYGLATYPKKIGSEAIKRIVTRALYAQGLRYRLPEGVRRHEFKGVHGFRKFFETQTTAAGMNIMYVQLLLDHSIGLSDSYLRPTEEQLLNNYLKAVPALTINYDTDKSVLQKQVSELAQKNEEQNYIIKGKLAEKEREAEQTKREFEEMKARQATFEERTSSQIDNLFQVVVEFIARENNLNRDDPEDVKKLRHSMVEALNSTEHYFGHKTFLKGQEDLSSIWKKKKE